MITEDKITDFFCIADDFHKVFDAQLAKNTFKNLEITCYQRLFSTKTHKIACVPK